MKRKRIVLLFASMLILSTGTYYTSAYLKTSVVTVNHMRFIGEDGLDGMLTEPSWNPENAKLTVPGAVIPKDPIIQNTSASGLSAVAVMKVEFVYTDQYPVSSQRGRLLSAEDMRYISELMTIDFNSELTGEWKRFDEEDADDVIQHFYYTKALRPGKDKNGEQTKPLFTKLTMDKRAGSKQFARLLEMNGFDMRLNGQLVQYDGNPSVKEQDNILTMYQNGLLAMKEM